jgi:cystathionine beta-lyase
MIILCNPHNPVGRVWKKNKLLKIGEICKKYNILILSDEIHSDLCFKGYKHIPIASLSEDLNSRTVCCMAPSKTFNIAGLATSIIIIPNKRLRDKFNTQLDTLHLSLGNLFGNTAMKAGYEDGEEWLNQMIAYLESNVKFVENFIKEKIPKVKLCKAEATYLLWLNFSELGLNDEDLQNLMLNKAKVGLNRGTSFGDGGEGFLRMNIACPTSTLEEGLNKILKAINTLL